VHGCERNDLDTTDGCAGTEAVSPAAAEAALTLSVVTGRRLVTAADRIVCLARANSASLLTLEPQFVPE
jgi:hypothetical protein